MDFHGGGAEWHSGGKAATRLETQEFQPPLQAACTFISILQLWWPARPRNQRTSARRKARRPPVCPPNNHHHTHHTTTRPDWNPRARSCDCLVSVAAPPTQAKRLPAAALLFPRSRGRVARAIPPLRRESRPQDSTFSRSPLPLLFIPAISPCFSLCPSGTRIADCPPGPALIRSDSPGLAVSPSPLHSSAGLSPGSNQPNPHRVERHKSHCRTFLLVLQHNPPKWLRSPNSTTSSAYVCLPTKTHPIWSRFHGTNSPRQVSPGATEQELKKAYKTGALKYHPGMSLPPLR